MNSQLNSWVSQARKSGMTNEQIRMHLLQAGWDEGAIQGALHVAKKTTGKNVFLGLTSVIFGIIIFIGIFVFIPMSKYFTKTFPESRLAARLSYYSPIIQTVVDNDVKKTFDNGFLIIRDFKQYRQSTIALPVYSYLHLLHKYDVMFVKNDGTIVWQRSYVDSALPRYDFEKNFTVGNFQLLPFSDIPPLILTDYLRRNSKVRSCTPTTLQLVNFEKEWTPSAPENALRGLGVKVDLESGTITTFSDPQQICETEAPAVLDSSIDYRCDADVDYVYQTGEREVINDQGLLGKYPVKKVFFQFPCGGIYQDGILGTSFRSVQPGPQDNVSLIF